MPTIPPEGASPQDALGELLKLIAVLRRNAGVPESEYWEFHTVERSPTAKGHDWDGMVLWSIIRGRGDAVIVWVTRSVPWTDPWPDPAATCQLHMLGRSAVLPDVDMAQAIERLPPTLTPRPGDPAIQIWLARAFQPGHRVWWELRRQPGQGMRVSLEGLTLQTDKQDVDTIWPARTLLNGIPPHAGRTAALSREELERGVVAVMANLWKSRRTKPSLRDVAMYLGNKPETFSPLHRIDSGEAALRQRIRRAGLKLPDLWRQAEPKL